MKIKPLILFLSSLILISSIPLIIFGSPNIDVIDDEEDDDVTVVASSIVETTTETTTQQGRGNITTTSTTGRSVHFGQIELTTQAKKETTTESRREVSEVSSVAPSEASTAHVHDYKIIDFSGETGVGTIRCSLCGDTYTDLFVNHLFSETHQSMQLSDEPWDVVPDEVINGKDYAYLFKQFYSYYSFIADFLSSKEFLYKEQFAFIYITLLFIISTGAICFTVRRGKK